MDGCGCCLFTLHLQQHGCSIVAFISNFSGLSFLFRGNKLVVSVCLVFTSALTGFSLVLGCCFPPCSAVVFFLCDEKTYMTDLTVFISCELFVLVDRLLVPTVQ